MRRRISSASMQQASHRCTRTRPSPTRGITTPPGRGSSWAPAAEATNQKEFVLGASGGGRKTKGEGMNKKRSMELKTR